MSVQYVSATSDANRVILEQLDQCLNEVLKQRHGEIRINITPGDKVDEVRVTISTNRHSQHVIRMR